MNLRLRKIALSLGAALLIALSASQAFAQEQPPSTSPANDTSQMARVAGTVLRAGTDEPLRKARVSLSNKDDKTSSRHAAVTGADGKFAFEGLAPGPYDLSADHDGYVAKSYGEDSAGHGSAVLSLASGQKMEDLVFRLQKCAVISGRVVDADGDPVRGLTVEAVTRTTYHGKSVSAGVVQSDTNDLGEYRLFDLAPGRYYIRATPKDFEWMPGRVIDQATGPGAKEENGYVVTFYPDAADVSRASAFDLKTGDEIQGMDFSLIRNRTYKIRGHVIDTTSGNGVLGYMINVLSKDDFSFNNVANSIADKNASFEVTGLPPGSYVVMAVGNEEGRLVQGLEHVDITNADVDSVRLVIKLGAEIRGRFTTEGISALPKVLMISLVPSDSEVGFGGGNAGVKADGTFVIRDMLDGTYRIKISTDCGECYLKSAKMNGLDLLEKGLQVAGEAPQQLEVLLSNHSGKVDGTVTRDDDLPAVGAKVLLVPDPPYRDWSARYKDATTDQYGRFSIRGVAPGNYTVFAFKHIPDDADLTDPEFIKPFESQGQALALDEDGKKTLQLKLITNDPDAPAK